MLSIVTAPNGVLAQIAKPVPKVDQTITALIAEMKETLDSTHDPEGVGLAAPQVGKSLRLFLIKPTKNAKHEVYINPVITLINEKPNAEPFDKLRTSQHKSRKKADGTKLEGCLSLPTIWGPVARAPKVKISFLSEFGRKRTQTVSGFKAVILQHEYDHLEGVLFPKRVLEQKGKLYKSSKNKKGEDQFEEIEL